MPNANNRRMPRPPEKRKPESSQPLNKQEYARLQKIDEASLELSVEERACANLCVEYDRECAAATLGTSLDTVAEIMARPCVRRHLEKADEKFLIEVARMKVRRLRKLKIGRLEVQERLMELALMDPSETKGRIDGQVKACLTLALTLGMMMGTDKDPLRDKTPEELQGIVQRVAGLLPAPTQTPQ